MLTLLTEIILVPFEFYGYSLPCERLGGAIRKDYDVARTSILQARCGIFFKRDA